jgi:hypothetical protein
MKICSFCEKGEDAGRRLIAGPRVWICTECIDLATTLAAEDVGAGGLDRSGRTEPAACSFCGGTDRFVVVGPLVCICAHCVEDCNQELRR